MLRFTFLAIATIAATNLFTTESASAQSWGYSQDYNRHTYSTPPVLGRGAGYATYGSTGNRSMGYCGSTGSGKPCCATCRPGDCANGLCAANCEGGCCVKTGLGGTSCRNGSCGHAGHSAHRHTSSGFCPDGRCRPTSGYSTSVYRPY